MSNPKNGSPYDSRKYKAKFINDYYFSKLDLLKAKNSIIFNKMNPKNKYQKS
jgi:hypothetical protein